MSTLTTTTSPSDLEPEESIAVIQRERAAKKTLVIVGLVVALLAMIGVTMLMYQDTPSEVPADRIGAPSFE